MRQRTHFLCSGSVLISQFFFRGKVWRVCYEQICIHLKFMCLSSYPLVPQNVTVFGDRAFKRIVKWNEFVRVGSDLVWWVSYKNRLGHGHPEKDTGRRNWASQGGWPQKELTLLTPWCWTWSLQNCEKINVYCLRQPVCGTLSWQQQTNMEGR